MAELTPLELRQAEVAQYEDNIALYTSIANSLPSEYPEHLAHLKGATDKHAAIAQVTDLEDVALLSNLWAHDDAQAAIRANIVERSKAQAILNAISQ